MQTKDYYKILELHPSATPKEIKTAYRRLAHHYHPDKNANDPYAAAQFEIIKEAYEVLINPSKKEYYLQQRWFDQVMGKQQTTAIVTPITVLKQLLELEKYISRMDIHRMDKEGLYAFINHILSEETIQKLNHFNEKDINTSIIDSTLKSGRLLHYPDANSLSIKLLKINANENAVQSIHRFVLHVRRTYTWNRYKVWLILFIVILLSLLIFLL